MNSRFCFLIDDDEDDREIFAMALKKAKAEFICTMAHNGKEAITKAQEGDFVPSYIFVDLNMPSVSGRDVVKAFNTIDRFKNVATIVYTTSSSEKDISELKEMGVTHYLVKPTSFSVLVDILSNLFAHKEMPFFLGEAVAQKSN